MDLPTILLTVVVGWAAGIIRGFAGFGGPAFILAVLTWFLTPLEVIGKILVIEFFVSIYLAWEVRKQVDWRTTAALTIPAIASMPIGHWMLLHTDAELMSRAISLAILVSCSLMLFDLRLPGKLPLWGLVVIGIVGGAIIGASYIALALVALILLGQYDRNETRTLLVISGFFFAAWYVILSVYRGQTGVTDIITAIPMVFAYLGGSWLGASLFKRSTEKSYRNYALYLLIALSIFGLVH